MEMETFIEMAERVLKDALEEAGMWHEDLQIEVKIFTKSEVPGSDEPREVS